MCVSFLSSNDDERQWGVSRTADNEEKSKEEKRR